MQSRVPPPLSTSRRSLSSELLWTLDSASKTGSEVPGHPGRHKAAHCPVAGAAAMSKAEMYLWPFDSTEINGVRELADHYQTERASSALEWLP